jgi:hypothetical protein
LFELKDFRDLSELRTVDTLADTAWDLVWSLKKIWGRLERRYKDSPDKLGGNIVAETILGMNLAVLPLISDIIAIQNQISLIVEDLQKQFALSGQTENSYHYSEEFVHSTSLVPVNMTYFKRGTYYSTIYVATLHFKFKYKMREILPAIQAYWGLGLSPEALWNCLPLSFIFDYFITVAKALSAMKKDPNVVLFPTEYCESLRTSRTFGEHLDPTFHPCPIIVDDRFTSHTRLVAGRSACLYTRKGALQNKGTTLPRFKLPHSTQLLNLAALARLAM